MILPSKVLIKKINKHPTDSHTIFRWSFAHYRCKVTIQLLRDKRIYKDIKSLINIGATSSLVAGDLFVNQ